MRREAFAAPRRSPRRSGAGSVPRAPAMLISHARVAVREGGGLGCDAADRAAEREDLDHRETRADLASRGRHQVLDQVVGQLGGESGLDVGVQRPGRRSSSSVSVWISRYGTVASSTRRRSELALNDLEQQLRPSLERRPDHSISDMTPGVPTSALRASTAQRRAPRRRKLVHSSSSGASCALIRRCARRASTSGARSSGWNVARIGELRSARAARNSNSVTTPKLPPPPRMPQNRSGFSSALASEDPAVGE